VSPLARIGAFGALLVLVFAGASLAGSSVDPGVDEPEAGHPAEEDHSAEEGAAAGESAPGLALEQSGYRLELEGDTAAAGPGGRLSFRIVGRDGETIQDFDTEHERRMHLIVVRRDFAGFQHLHPAQSADGTWSVELGEMLPGVHRVFADFSTGGDAVTLAADLFVPGRFAPAALPEPAATADAGDGYEVAIDSGDLPAGGTALTRFTVSRGGREVGAVRPYLGADGHLVALREGDQAYLHTHPEGEPGGRGPISFGVSYPSAGRYRLFLQFRHGGEVRTAAFTQVVEPVGAHGGER
jgi:hypothetical protein